MCKGNSYLDAISFLCSKCNKNFKIRLKNCIHKNNGQTEIMVFFLSEKEIRIHVWHIVNFFVFII